MTGLDILRRRCPWPGMRPDVPRHYTRDEPTGWCAGENRKMFADLLADAKIIIDGGSFLGLSAWWLLRSAPRATLICIDHWRGSAEHQKVWAATLPVLYETFLVNLWEFRDRVIPLRADSVAGMEEVASLGILPDAVYVDWSHDRASVARDTTKATELFPRAIACGDDWGWTSVQEGIADVLAARPDLEVVDYRTCWRLKKKAESGP